MNTEKKNDGINVEEATFDKEGNLAGVSEIADKDLEDVDGGISINCYKCTSAAE